MGRTANQAISNRTSIIRIQKISCTNLLTINRNSTKVRCCQIFISLKTNCMYCRALKLLRLIATGWIIGLTRQIVLFSIWILSYKELTLSINSLPCLRTWALLNQLLTKLSILKISFKNLTSLSLLIQIAFLTKLLERKDN